MSYLSTRHKKRPAEQEDINLAGISSETIYFLHSQGEISDEEMERYFLDETGSYLPKLKNSPKDGRYIQGR